MVLTGTDGYETDHTHKHTVHFAQSIESTVLVLLQADICQEIRDTLLIGKYSAVSKSSGS